MSNEIKIEDFSEEIYWTVKCPLCEEYTDTPDDPNHEESIFCESCLNELIIKES